MEQIELNEDVDIETALAEFIADRRHVDYDDEKPTNQYKLLQYLLHNEIPVNSESLHLAYLELKSQRQLELLKKAESAPAPSPYLSPVRRVHRNFRNGQPVDDFGHVIGKP